MICIVAVDSFAAAGPVVAAVANAVDDLGYGCFGCHFRHSHIHLRDRNRLRIHRFLRHLSCRYVHCVFHRLLKKKILNLL